MWNRDSNKPLKAYEAYSAKEIYYKKTDAVQVADLDGVCLYGMISVGEGVKGLIAVFGIRE